MSYAAAIDQLSAMTPELHTQPGHARRKFSLAEIGLLLEALGNPHRRFPSVLIAGTNGKGSTAATLASILRQSSPRVGLYTSPHLTRPNERIRVNGREISDGDFAALYFRVHDCGETLVRDGKLLQQPSFFETLTAMAFLYFAETASDFAVLEVGMGGRLDATNIVDPLLSIVTDISLDHMEWLGPTISAITREKAGILRPHGILITLPQHPEANQVLGEIATDLGVRAISAVSYMPQTAPPARTRHEQFARTTAKFTEPGVAVHSCNPAAQTERGDSLSPRIPANQVVGALTLETHAYPIEVLGATISVDSPLHGDHQHRNVALAIASAVELAEHHHFPITPDTIAAGVRSTQWPGRLEAFSLTKKLDASGLDFETWEGTPGSAPAETLPTLAPPQVAALQAPHVLVLDVAHNPAGAWALRAALRSEFAIDAPDKKAAALLFGCLRDKPLAEMAQILFPLFEEVIFAPIHSPRATPMSDLLVAAEAVGVPARAASSIEEALAWAASISISSANVTRPASTPAVESSASGHEFTRADRTALQQQGASAPATVAGAASSGNDPSRREALFAPRVVVVAGSVYLVGEVRPLLLAPSK
jgi:dihydrofolate synthase / folylpolyglutamate synthase